MPKQQNKLDFAEKVKVLDWLRDNQGRIRKGEWSTSITARMATEETGINVVPAMVRGMMGDHGKATIRYVWPHSPIVKRVGTAAESEAIRILSREVRDLSESLGRRLSPDFLRVFPEGDEGGGTDSGGQ